MLHRIRLLLAEVYHYEKDSAVDSTHMRRVLTMTVIILFALNISCNGLAQLGVFVFTCLIGILLLFIVWRMPGTRNEKRLVTFGAVVIALVALVLLVQNENSGFQNLWLFLLPAILFIQAGLPIAVPVCCFYGVAASLLLWFWPLHGYPTGYRFYYPAFYWSFCLLMTTADLFYKHYRIQREKSEQEMEQEIQSTMAEARRLMVSSVAAISQMIDEKDRYTSEHSHRVAEYARRIGAHMGLEGEELERLYRSALLHDIGKISVPDAILNKPARLTDEEFAIMKQHTVWGRKILEGLEFLPQADWGASYHHERFDGKGYPSGLKGDQLPQMVWIISAADALDAMSSDRCYRRRCDTGYIIGEFRKWSGKQFEPAVAQAVVELLECGALPEKEGAHDAEEETGRKSDEKTNS